MAATYDIVNGGLATPTITPTGGPYPAAQIVTIAGGAPGVVIRYTLDETDPGLMSAIYAAPLRVDWTRTVKARAFKGGWAPSGTATQTYTIEPSGTVSPPAFSIPSGAYTTKRTVYLTTPTVGADVRYTTNGVDPVAGSPIATSQGLVVDKHMRVKASAWKNGMVTSPIRTADYQITGAISSGSAHVLAVKTDGSVLTWSAAAPTVKALLPPVVVAVAAGQNSPPHSAAVELHEPGVQTDGRVLSWGENLNGQLGNGTALPSTDPVPALIALGQAVTGVVAVAAGQAHTVALKADGTVLAWGWNAWGQLGDGTATSRSMAVTVTAEGQPPVPLSGVIAISAGALHSVALKADGTVWTWGNNDFGQLGYGVVGGVHYRAQMVGTLTGISSVAAGGSRTFAVKTDGAASGSVWAWGNNGNDGYLGDGSATDRSVPVRVLERGIAVSTGSIRTLFLRSEPSGQRTLWGTGWHYANVPSPGGGTNSIVPVMVVAGDFVSLSVNTKIVALRRDTSLLVWGDNRFGDGQVLGVAGSENDDPDQDGLTNAQEAAIGSDPWNPDTNGDGISVGTDPFVADTDGDGVLDGADAFPLDPLRSQAPPPVPGDTTPPVITLTEPTNAIPVP